MNNVLEGFIRDNLIMDENRDDVIHFSYSGKAAKSFGYHTAILNNGEKIKFTCQTTDKSSDDEYKWEDKVQFEPIKRIDIAQWQYDNYLSMESKMTNVMRKMIEEEARARNLDGLESTSGYRNYR
jgi:hypothetical protein